MSGGTMTAVTAAASTDKRQGGVHLGADLIKSADPTPGPPLEN
jgi:hypothetical protein